MSLTRPNPFLSKWAENGKRFDVPNSGSDIANGRADIQTGFPEITMKSVINGGVPPWGQDHNGILYKLTEANQWTQAGGLPVFNQDLCDRIGGYPVGALLQTSDATKPWVFWINLVDGNIHNPDENIINTKQIQNDWVRYPVLSNFEGNSIYFEKDGSLAIASQTIITSVYVSSSLGSDETGKGTKEYPFKTIIHAINTTEASGGVSVFLNVDDVFYLSPNGTGNITENKDGLVYDIQNRYIKFFGYNVSSDEIDNLVRKCEYLWGDGTWGHCIKNTKRPKIIYPWGDKYISGKKTNTYIYGLNSSTSSASVTFYGIDIEVDRVTDLNNENVSIWTTGFWNGLKYTFIGCKFNEMPANAKQRFAGLGASVSTYFSFNYANFFSYNSFNNFFSRPQQWSINSEDDIDELILGDTNYIRMASNVREVLGDNKAFGGDVQYTNNPSKSYYNLQTNFNIKNVTAYV